MILIYKSEDKTAIKKRIYIKEACGWKVIRPLKRNLFGKWSVKMEKL